jgi:hypothetical protein
VVAVGDTLEVPLSPTAPLAPLTAVQLSAFSVDQLNVTLVPAVMVVGFAVKVTMGAGAVAALTVILVEACALPPAPLHDNP